MSRLHWNGVILPAGIAEDVSSDKTYYAVVKPRNPASTSSTLDQVASQAVYQACLPSLFTKPVYHAVCHACLPSLSTKPVYQACPPSLSAMPVYHA